MTLTDELVTNDPAQSFQLGSSSTEPSEQLSDPALEEMRQLLVAARTLPVLFVGSGISRRYIGSPDWEGLLNQFALKTGWPLTYYAGKVDGDLPKAASAIADAFYELWWKAPEYEDSRKEHGPMILSRSDPLKVEIARYIESLEYPEDDVKVRELEHLAKVRVHAVITTNWDTVLERSLPDLEVYVGQQDVLFSTTHAVGELYKIHGTVSDPRTLVLTGEDYEAYWERNPYLVAKLLTLFVEHPVVFFGYSLRDPHIQKLLTNLADCLSDEQMGKLNDRLIFVGRPGENRPEGFLKSRITIGLHSVGIYELGSDNLGEVFSMIGNLHQHFPTKLIRQLQESVYELAFSSEPTGKFYVLEFDPERDVDEVEVVIGIGITDKLDIRYQKYSRRSLFLDMLRCEPHRSGSQIVEQGIPEIFKNAKFAPIFYPLYLEGRLSGNFDKFDPENLPDRARNLISGDGLTPYPGKDAANRKVQYFREILAEDAKAAENFGVNCRYEIDDVVALRDFLTVRLESDEDLSTPIAKLCCKYDRIVFGNDWEGDSVELRRALGINGTVPDTSQLMAAIGEL